MTFSLSDSCLLSLLPSLPNLDSKDCHRNSLAWTFHSFILLYLHCTSLAKAKLWLYSTLPTPHVLEQLSGIKEKHSGFTHLDTDLK